MIIGLNVFALNTFAGPMGIPLTGDWNEICRGNQMGYTLVDKPEDIFSPIEAAADGWTDINRSYNDEFFKAPVAEDDWTDILPDPEDPTIKRC